MSDAEQLETENAKLRDLIHRIQPVLYELYQGYADVMSLSDEDTTAYIDVMTFDNPAVDEGKTNE